MKRIGLVAILLFFITISASAQRFAYVDSDYILKHIPEYTSSQKFLDATSATWQKEVDLKFADIEKLFKAYQVDQVLLTEDMRKRREAEIIAKENEAKEFQRIKFGFEGELFQVRTKLIKPIQDRISNAIKAVADAQQLDIIFDKTSEITLLYASPRLDKSNDVITRLGYKPGTFVTN